MRTLRRPRTEASDGLVGTARVGGHARALSDRLGRGDIAVIDHIDLDRATAARIVGCGAAAVVNVSPTVSGRYPSLGATVLLDAGVELLDDVGPDVMTRVRDGDRLRLSGDELSCGERIVARGTRQSADSVTQTLRRAEEGLSVQMEAFAASAAEYLRREHRLVLEPGTVPTTRASVAGRDVIVVAPGPEHRDDLARLRRFAKEYRPVVIAVDEAADSARELGFAPAVLVGDLAGVSDEAIRHAQDIIVRLDPDGTTAGLARVDRLGVSRTTITTTARSVDLALLVAAEADARTIITAGTDRTLVSMLDSGSTEAAADFVTRLRVGSRLIDGSAVAELHRPRVSGWLVGLMLVVAVLTLGVAVWLTPVGNQVVSDLTDVWPASLADAIDAVRGTSVEEPSP